MPIISRFKDACSSLVWLAVCFVASSAQAEIRQIQEFSFAQKQPAWTLGDIYGRFEQQALALTQSGDLLILSPRQTGVWELYRVRGWATGRPVIDHLQLADYISSHDQHDLEDLKVKLYVSPDGVSAVCVGSAFWLKRVNGKAVGKSRTNSIISVVDLASFKPVKRAETKALDLLEFQSVEMDKEGRILVSSSVFGNTPQREFIRLVVPSLELGQKCIYTMVKNGPNTEQAIAKTIESCEQALGAVSLEEYLKRSAATPPAAGFICKDVKAEYCPQPDRFTPDGRIGLGIRSEGHDDFWGSWVQTRTTAIVFSTQTKAEIGELDLTRTSPYLKLASLNGEDFLVSVEAGSKVRVYELGELNS